MTQQAAHGRPLSQSWVLTCPPGADCYKGLFLVEIVRSLFR
jgi:hypothetical protein